MRTPETARPEEGNPRAARAVNLAVKFYRPYPYIRKRRRVAPAVKRIVVSLFCRLPAALWPVAGAIARFFWPSFGRA